MVCSETGNQIENDIIIINKSKSGEKKEENIEWRKDALKIETKVL